MGGLRRNAITHATPIHCFEARNDEGAVRWVLIPAAYCDTERARERARGLLRPGYELTGRRTWRGDWSAIGASDKGQSDYAG